MIELTRTITIQLDKYLKLQTESTESTKWKYKNIFW